MNPDDFNRLGFFPAEPESRVAVGIDPGFSIDHAGVVVIERLRLPIPPEQGGVGTDLRQRLSTPIYVVRRIINYPLRTPLVQVIEDCKPENLTIRVTDEYGQPADVLIPEAERVVDVTGAQAFRELAKERGFKFTPLMIGGGGFESQGQDSRGTDRASKARLVSEVDAALATRELLLPDDLEDGQILLDQLSAFRMRRSPTTGAPQWSDSEGVHDDVLMGASYALRTLRSTKGSAWNLVHEVFRNAEPRQLLKGSFVMPPPPDWYRS